MLVRDLQDDPIYAWKFRAPFIVSGNRYRDQPRFGGIDERLPYVYLTDMPSAARLRRTVALTKPRGGNLLRVFLID